MRGQRRKVFPASLRSLSSWMAVREKGTLLSRPPDPSIRSGLDRYIAISLLVHIGVVTLLAFLPSRGIGLVERPPVSVHILKLTDLEVPTQEQKSEAPREEPRREARPSRMVKPSPPKAEPPSQPEPFPLSGPKAIESPRSTLPQAATKPDALTVEKEVDGQGRLKRAIKPFIPEVNPFLPQTLFSATVPKAVQGPGVAQPAEVKKPTLLPATEAVEEPKRTKTPLEALTVEGPSLRPHRFAAEQEGPKVVGGGRSAEVGRPSRLENLARLEGQEERGASRQPKDVGVRGLEPAPVVPKQPTSLEGGAAAGPKAVEGKPGEARRSTPAVIERLGAGEGKVAQKRQEVTVKGLEAPSLLQPSLSPQAAGEAGPKAVEGKPGEARRSTPAVIERLGAGEGQAAPQARKASVKGLERAPAPGRPSLAPEAGGAAAPKAVGGGTGEAIGPGGPPSVARLGSEEGKAASSRKREGGTGLEGAPGPGRPSLAPEAGGAAAPKAVGGSPGQAAGPGGPPAVAPLSAEGRGGGPRGGTGDDLSKELLPGRGTLGDFGGPQDVKIPERFLKAGRGPGERKRAGVGLIDTSDPDFTEYFETLKQRVYTAWKYPKGIRGEHKVSLRFHLDQAGGVHNIKVVDSTNRTLNESAVQAMERASPFPPIPEKFKKLVGEPLILIFTVIIQ